MNRTFRDEQLLSHFQLPLQKLMELNVKTLQSMSYMRPDDLLNVKKPEAFFEKNMDIFIQNGHMALNYLHDTFAILENHWVKTAEASESIVKDTIQEGKRTFKKKAAKSPIKAATKTAAKMATKTSAKTAIKATKATKPMKAKLAKSAAQKAPKKTKAKVASATKTSGHSPLGVHVSHMPN